ncbi:NADP-dependent oxidoreductase [Hyalangium versicolor]|uniref:NADP-dependent oxidoreductase n=1 Tax=Hyalangium versicolor TaxID=2861190 RepID=UPI001CCAC07B|nr:NADP-dependent oxidoreductase [Hyalangium versicolor]
MKALAATSYGSAEELKIIDLPRPRPERGQILVRIAAATINATDIRAVTGGLRGVLDLQFPYVLGNDFSGTVIQVGDGVTAFAEGDEVFGQALPRQLRPLLTSAHPSLSTGALAEYAVFETDTPMLAHRPASVSHVHAASLGIAGMAACSLMRLAHIKPGETALVIGSTGGVGSIVVPLLARAGARVIATAAGERAVTIMRELGATDTVGYDSSEYPRDVDIIVNCVLPAGAVSAAAATLREGGRIVSTVPPTPTAEQLGRDDVAVNVVDWNVDYLPMSELADAAARGELTATIESVHPLSRAGDAVRDFLSNSTVGKVVVTM